jgi:hypothetical protein
MRAFPAARLKQALWLAGCLLCRTVAGAGGRSAVAVGVYQAWGGGFVRRAVSRFGGDRVFADRLAGDLEPLFPFLGVLRLVVGVQQQPSAQRATAVLGLVPRPGS